MVCLHSDEGSQHVVMRTLANSSNLDRSLHSMWTDTYVTPDLDSTAAADLVSYDVTVDTVFKSPIVDCAWDFVKGKKMEFRVS